MHPSGNMQIGNIVISQTKCETFFHYERKAKKKDQIVFHPLNVITFVLICTFNYPHKGETNQAKLWLILAQEIMQIFYYLTGHLKFTVFFAHAGLL